MAVSPHLTPLQRIEMWTDKSAGPDECWPWTGPRHPSGYGVMKYKGSTLWAHRMAWAAATRRIFPKANKARDLCVCHRCDNPICVNPAHLWLGTKSDNAKDRHQKGRDPLGERNGNRALSLEDVRSIRRSEDNTLTLAQRYGVDKSTIWRVRTKRMWAHVK